ncbi:ABC transporter ATP-binding protein [Candidatus Viridilinea mediisalina]|uniref:Spermidine/putrescine import ATP-binding protein PotA n=1 Tax=Candidatus Viridilinea mediisalina TaxID=2024553 RepID=A0A2A6RL53_9CHLR|nr:ABC transporter ATP-binding protein [Candidatus Viridilinea mediisalina]PDW03619.1 spermidine/putrescine ABC transporter ATP-binding protein [Candidatus Viridilinea mediisalina]
MSDTPAIELRHVVKQFGATYAVDHVSLQIGDGEFFSLLGPSGCGKTTTLRMIAGFEYPSSGEVLIHGCPMAATPPHRRPVNTVFQSYALFPHMSVEQNVAFGLQMKRLPKHEIGPRVQAALALVRLEGFEQRRPREMSGGQQQRVALARALVNQPEVLLLDEPLGALDQKLRKEMQFELKSLQHRVGITFIFVTHDQEEALIMSDRIAVMNQGKVLQVGSPTEIYERPTCRFVADFIGETNFIDGQVVAHAGDYATIVSRDGLELRGMMPRPIAVGSQATLSIRPEKTRLLTLDQAGNGHGACSFPATVELVSYIGSDTRITVRLNAQRTLHVWEQNTRSTLDRNAYWQPGEAALLVCPPENALVLVE